jgi:valyl-tRNA synthetase
MSTPINTLIGDKLTAKDLLLPGLGKPYIRKLESCGRFLYARYSSAEDGETPHSTDSIDRWFLHLLNTRLVWADELRYQNRIRALFRLLHELLIKEFSRWYLELIKDVDKTPLQRRARKGILFLMFEQMLLLNSSFLPDTCRQIHTQLFTTSPSSLDVGERVGYRGSWIYPDEFQEVDSLKELIRLIRKNRRYQKYRNPEPGEVHIHAASKSDIRLIEKYRSQITRLGGVGEITVCRSSKQLEELPDEANRYSKWRLSFEPHTAG